MRKYKQLSVEQKSRIMTLVSENYSNSEIARRIGFSEWTVRNLRRKYEQTGSVLRKKGSGRKRARTKKEEALLKRMCSRNRFATASKLRNELARVQEKPCSTRTVQRRLKEMGLDSRKPAKRLLLTKTMRRNRLLWCKEHQSWTTDDWKRVIFSDESKFNLIGPDGIQNVRRRKGERYRAECTLPAVRHSPSIMVWGVITAFGTGQILITKGIVNAKKYKKIIDDGVVPTIEELFSHIPDPVFQNDSAPCHRAQSIKNYKEELGIESLSWPGNSPDLNPIGNVWAIMKKKIRESGLETIIELERVIENVWENQITQQIIDNLYRSMPKRIEAVIKAKGGSIKY